MCAILGTQLFWSFIFGVLMCSRVLADSPRLLVFWEFHTHPPTPQTPKCERARAPCPALPNPWRAISICVSMCVGAMVEKAGQPQKAARMLVDFALRNGSFDNIGPSPCLHACVCLCVCVCMCVCTCVCWHACVHACVRSGRRLSNTR